MHRRSVRDQKRFPSALDKWSWEAVVVVNGGSDNSLELCKQLEARDPRFRVVAKLLPPVYHLHKNIPLSSYQKL